MKKLLASLAVTATLLLAPSTALADTLPVGVSPTSPSSNLGPTYSLTQNLTNINGTYYYITIFGIGLFAIDPPSIM
jgi:hypothetical protein